MLIAAFNQRTMQGQPAIPPPATIAEPSARRAAIHQLNHLPWGHPNAVELRRLFRQSGEWQR